MRRCSAITTAPGASGRRPTEKLEGSCRVVFCRVIGRIEKHHFVGSWFWMRFRSFPQERSHAAGVNVKSTVDPKTLQIAVQRLESCWRPLDKSDALCTAAAAPQPTRPATRTGPRKLLPSIRGRKAQLKKRLPQPVGRWARAQTRRSVEHARSIPSGDNAHRLRA